MKSRFLMIGYGWRSRFYVRAAQALPKELELAAVVMQSEKRAKEIQEETGFFATADLEKALETKPDFAIVSVPREVMKDWIVRLMEKQIPVLCETPPGKDVAELNELWKEKQRLGGRVQVAEQYFLQPYYGAVQQIIDEGTLGKISNIFLSALHGYHAISIFRRFFGLKYEDCQISGKSYSFPVTVTRTRAGWTQEGEIREARRDRLDLVFEGGQTGFFDFAGEQYHNVLRSRTWNVQGERGELRDTKVWYLDQDNRPVMEEIHREDDGIYNNDEWSHMYMSFRGHRIYENPFPGVRLNDDELAVADMMMHMKAYVEKGIDFYPLEEGLQDAYLNFCMDEALETGKTVQTTHQSWTMD